MRSGFSIPPKDGISLRPQPRLSLSPKAGASPTPRPERPSPPKPELSSPPRASLSGPLRPGSSLPGAAPVLLKPSAVDTIIQSSTVEILRSYEITVAPRARTEVLGHVPSSDVVGIIAFEGPNIAGNLTLAVPTSVCHPAMPRRARNTTHAEWTYEITNQVMGSIKNRLIQFQVRLRTHVPTVLSGVALERHKRRTAVEVLYSFAALRGDVSLMVDASLARASLEYSNAALVVSDNDPLLFG